MLASKYKCFQFNETSLFDQHIGPAYKDDILEDLKIVNGSNSTKTTTIKVKVIKIKGIINDTDNEIQYYWYNNDTHVVYDFDLHYPIGKVKYNLDGIPEKIDKDTYKIEIIHIPEII